MSRRGWLLFVAMSVIWGTPYLLIKVAVAEVSPWALVFIRTAVGAALLVPLVARRRHFRSLRGRWWPLLAYATAEVVTPWLLLSDAERALSSGTTGLLIATVPIMGVLLARVTGDRQPVTTVRWLGLAMGFGGVALLTGPTLGAGGGIWAITEVLLAAFGFAVAPLVADRALRDTSGLVVTAVSLAFATVVYAPAAAWTWPDELPSVPVLTALAALATIGTALAFLLFFELIREVGAARATVVTYLNPVVAVILGAVILDESLTLTVLAAFVFILVGSVLATRRPREPTTGVRAAQDHASDPSAPASESVREDQRPSEAV